MHINATTDPGEDITLACRAGITLANRTGMTVHFKFNGVTCIAKEGADPKELEWLLRAEMKTDHDNKMVCAQP